MQGNMHATHCPAAPRTPHHMYVGAVSSDPTHPHEALLTRTHVCSRFSFCHHLIALQFLFAALSTRLLVRIFFTVQFLSAAISTWLLMRIFPTVQFLFATISTQLLVHIFFASSVRRRLDHRCRNQCRMYAHLFLCLCLTLDLCVIYCPSSDSPFPGSGFLKFAFLVVRLDKVSWQGWNASTRCKT